MRRPFGKIMDGGYSGLVSLLDSADLQTRTIQEDHLGILVPGTGTWADEALREE